MAVLKKIKSSSLIESLTASIIVVLVFMVASFSFNNVLMNTVRTDEFSLNTHLRELRYLMLHDKLTFPFYEEGQYWVIRSEDIENQTLLMVLNKRSNKTYTIAVNGYKEKN